MRKNKRRIIIKDIINNEFNLIEDRKKKTSKKNFKDINC